MEQLLFTVDRSAYGTLEVIRQKWPGILWSDEELLAGTDGGRGFYVTDPGATLRLSRCRAITGLRNLAEPEPDILPNVRHNGEIEEDDD